MFFSGIIVGDTCVCQAREEGEKCEYLKSKATHPKDILDRKASGM